MLVIDAITAAAATGVLASAAGSDWRTRTVSNRHWWAILPAAAVTVVLHPLAIVTGVLAVFIGLAAYYMPDGMGGADAKAIMATGFLFPDLVVFLSLLGVACLGSYVWIALRQQRCPFLIPLGAAMVVGLIGGLLA